jgi:hypothetical protein
MGRVSAALKQGDVGTFLNQYEASYHLLTRYNNNQCVDVWFEWNASGIDPDFDESGTNSSDLLYLRLQKTAGACN